MKREIGYYWILVNREWEIGYYDGTENVEWETLTSRWEENEIKEIDERRIIRPL